MTRLVRNLGKLAALGSMLWLLAGMASPATAEINLNPWFYPKWGAGRGANQANSDAPSPEIADASAAGNGTNGQSVNRPARVAMSTSGKQPAYDGTAPASYQSGSTGDASGNPGYQSSGNRNGSTSVGPSQGRPQMAGQNAGQNQNGYGRMYGLQASRMQVGNSQSVMAPGGKSSSAPGAASSTVVPGTTKYMQAPPPGGVRAPVVGPNGVYIDGETIGPGQLHSAGVTYEGETQGPGPMMMGHGGDGFMNPYCNDCNGGDCGNGCCNSGWGNWGGWFGGCGSGQCGNGCCDDSCNDCSGHSPYGRPWILAPFDIMFGEMSSSCRGWWWGENLTVFVGTESFRSTVSFDGVSSFGFNEGFNWSVPVSRTFGWAFQFGAEFTQSGFDSTPSSAIDESRTQTFITTGLYHRPACQCGMQYGMVLDWLHDEFYDHIDVAQLRGEVSWMIDCHNDYGFVFATGVDDDSPNSRFLRHGSFEALDQYAFFHRRRFCRGGDARFWLGGTNDDSALLGADFCIPVAQSWGLQGGFNWILSGNRNQRLADESWNIGVNVVYYIGANAFCQSPSRPLFGVADNSSLMTRVKGF